MAFTGLESVTFGVEDMAEALRFCRDWGLAETPQSGVFETLDGGRVVLRDAAEPGLPAGVGTVREVVWGLADQAALDALRSRLPLDAEGRIRDPNGLPMSFAVSRRRKVVAKPTMPNAPGAENRIDQRAPVHTQARPIKLGHLVLFAADFAAMRAFFEDTLGFILSDEYPGHGAFLRCAPRGEHHNVFLLNRPGKPGINHVAFTLTDLHEVIGGGIAMAQKGWKTEIGPGRHPISSAYFWYFHNPLGPPLEYYADDDFCTEAWVPRQFERKPELFAEWAVAGGIDGTTRRQVVAQDNSGRGHA